MSPVPAPGREAARETSRRGFLASLLAAPAAAPAFDPEHALWVPGAKLISVPAPRFLGPRYVRPPVYHWGIDGALYASHDTKVWVRVFGPHPAAATFVLRARAKFPPCPGTLFSA